MLNKFVESFFQGSFMNRKFKRIAFIWNRIFCDVNIFTLTFNQMKASFQKNILLISKPFNGSICSISVARVSKYFEDGVYQSVWASSQHSRLFLRSHF